MWVLHPDDYKRYQELGWLPKETVSPDSQSFTELLRQVVALQKRHEPKMGMRVPVNAISLPILERFRRYEASASSPVDFFRWLMLPGNEREKEAMMEAKTLQSEIAESMTEPPMCLSDVLLVANAKDLTKH